MKKLLFITTMLIALTSCSSKSGNEEPNSNIKRMLRPAYGIDNNLKIIRYVDSMYQIGDTIRIDMEGFSFDREAIIIK